jgi:hypothetical protein
VPQRLVAALGALAAALVVATGALAAPRFPSRARIEATLAKLATADATARTRMLLPFLRSLVHPRTVDDDHALGDVGWRIGRLYQQSDDDRVLEAVEAAGFDTEAAETMHGRLAHFLAWDPAFLRRHAKAASWVRGERGGAIVGAPLTIPSISDADSECRQGEQRDWGVYGYLRAASDPAARVAVDGRDTGLVTPIDFADHVMIAGGHHRIDFDIDGSVGSVEVDVPPDGNACAFMKRKVQH